MIKVNRVNQQVCRGGAKKERKVPFVHEAYAISLRVNIAPVRMMISFCRDKYG